MTADIFELITLRGTGNVGDFDDSDDFSRWLSFVIAGKNPC